MADIHAKDTFIPYVPIDDRDLYPAEDGEPMAVSDYHRDLLFWTLAALKEHLKKQDPAVYVSGDIMVYYREGDPRKSISPDVLVCFGIGSGGRPIYKVWEEGKVPDFVMEFSSKTTYTRDLGEKKAIYGSLGIQDYFLYDAEGLYLPEPLMGFTLVDGVYVRVSSDADGGVHSGVLGLDFRLRDDEIGLYDPVDGVWVQTRGDRTEIAEARADTAEAFAAEEGERADTAEAEAARLREEIARLKTRSSS